jgi:hypothetical protein
MKGLFPDPGRGIVSPLEIISVGLLSKTVISDIFGTASGQRAVWRA